MLGSFQNSARFTHFPTARLVSIGVSYQHDRRQKYREPLQELQRSNVQLRAVRADRDKARQLEIKNQE